MSRVFCLTGMHRSGTSLTASWLQDCGLVIDVGGLVGPTSGNPRGHYEDVEMMSLHRSEFLAQRRRSRGWRLDAPEFLWFSGERKLLAANLIEARNAQYDQWGWKDPRSLAFLPQWQQLEPGLRVVILWRPVAAVTSSLLRRAAGATNSDFRVSARQAVSSWIAYNELARQFTVSNPDSALMVPLDSVLRDGENVIAEIDRRFDMNLRPGSVSSRFEPDLLGAGEAADVLDRPWLRRKVHEAHALEASLAALSYVPA